MTPERGTPGNTFATFPARQFQFILDPYCLLNIDHTYCKSVFDLIHDLKLAEPKIDIHVLLPAYLASDEVLCQINRMNLGLHQIDEPNPTPNIDLESSILKDIQDKFKEKKGETNHALALLALSDLLQADGIITKSDILIDRQYAIYQYHRIKIIHSDEFADTVEVIAHGNSVFWSVLSPERKLNFDLFYLLSHWKNSRLFKWHEKVKLKISNEDLKDNLRSALLNRYPYILYSRDMIRYYELQGEYYSRRGLFQRFGLSLGYYLTTFYLMLWGMLDQLTVIAKYARDCNNLKEKDCGIRSRKFWKEFSVLEPGLKKFIKSKKIDDWIKVMAVMRHHAAHKVIKIPTEMCVDTEDSNKSDEDVLKIIRKDKALLYDFMPEPLMKNFEPTMVSIWKFRKMKVIAPRVVLFKDQSGKGYLRDPVISVDYDLDKLTAIMDAFIVRLFRNVR